MHDRKPERASQGMALAAEGDFTAFGYGIGQHGLNGFDRFAIDQRTLGNAVLKARTDAQRSSGFGELFHKPVMNSGLDAETVGADASPAGIAIFRANGTIDRPINVCIVKDDERRIAVQLHRDFLTVAAT